MSEKVTVKKLMQIGYACPSQWQAITDSGQDVYIRFRWGYLSLRVAEEEIYGEQIADRFDGVLSDSDMRKVLSDYCVFEG